MTWINFSKISVMMMSFDCPCPRGLSNCEPLSNIVSDDSLPVENRSFLCVGYNQAKERAFHQDRFRNCISSGNGEQNNYMADCDRRDLIDLVAVIGRALSIDENIRVYDKKTDEEMNDTDLIAIIRDED